MWHHLFNSQIGLIGCARVDRLLVRHLHRLTHGLTSGNGCYGHLANRTVGELPIVTGFCFAISQMNGEATLEGYPL